MPTNGGSSRWGIIKIVQLPNHDENVLHHISHQNVMEDDYSEIDQWYDWVDQMIESEDADAQST